LSGSTTNKSAPLAVDVAFSSLDTSNQLLLATSGGSDSYHETDCSADYASSESATYEDADLFGAPEDEVFALLGSAL
jgi:hypothetical protein